jgi:hypothetical protein
MLLATAFAQAHSLPLPANAPASFREECASCHLAFPPALLPGSDWKRVMATLDKHYGANAALDEKTRREIEQFLVANGASSARYAGAGEPPRLTRSAWFEREHREAQGAFGNAKVKSAANCAGCHRRADAGSFRENEINIPR